MKTDWAGIINTIQTEGGYSLTDLAPKVGLSIGALCDIKKGRTKEPRWQAANALMAMHDAMLKAAQRRAKRAA